MERILDALDTRLSADELARDLPPARVAFSSGLIGLTMLLAVAYPVLSVTIQWLFGSAISFGDQLIIEVGSAKTRIFVIFWLGPRHFLTFCQQGQNIGGAGRCLSLAPFFCPADCLVCRC